MKWWIITTAVLFVARAVLKFFLRVKYPKWNGKVSDMSVGQMVACIVSVFATIAVHIGFWVCLLVTAVKILLEVFG